MGSAGRSRAEEFKGTRDRAGPPTMALEGTKGPLWGQGFVGLDTWPFVGSGVRRAGHVALRGVRGS